MDNDFMDITKQQATVFQTNLYDWFADHPRPLPWKGEKNPYYIWLSEIILQQTRVEQGLPYFERFKNQFPSIFDLANASEDEVFKLWEGLGYYSRARNLHATAKFIANERQGVFPDSYEDILKLKGVGPYTAAAIASFAYNLPYSVLDGNVFRVLSRIWGIETPIDGTPGKKLFAQLAQLLLDKESPALYNQAIMDFGATHCMPKAPKCVSCNFQELCVALKNDWVGRLPIKKQKIKKRTRYFNYLVLEGDGHLLIEKRLAKDIWQHLYQFPLIETESALDNLEALKKQEAWQTFFQEKKPELIRVSKPFKQTLSHQYIVATFWEFQISLFPENWAKKYQIINRKNLSKFAFPKVVDWYLNDNSLYLDLR